MSDAGFGIAFFPHSALEKQVGKAKMHIMLSIALQITNYFR